MENASTETPADVRRGAHFLTQSAGVRVLDEVAVLEVTGDDTRNWLNGQITNDVRTTGAGDAVYALAVSVKGRVLADVWALDRGDDVFWLVVPEQSVAPLLEGFEAQIIMEDVEVEPRPELVVLTIAGPRAAEVVAAAGIPDAHVHPTDRLAVGGRDVIVGRENLDATRDALEGAARGLDGGGVGLASWELARLLRQAPRFGVDFDDRNYPQEAGLEARAVSFNKGCYLGQEVVCMLENRGKVSKRLVVVNVDGTTEVPVDAEIASVAKGEADGAAGGGQTVGRITTAGIDGEAVLAFGYVKSAFASPGTALTVDGRKAEVTAVIE